MCVEVCQLQTQWSAVTPPARCEATCVFDRIATLFPSARRSCTRDCTKCVFPTPAMPSTNKLPPLITSARASSSSTSHMLTRCCVYSARRAGPGDQRRQLIGGRNCGSGEDPLRAGSGARAARTGEDSRDPVEDPCGLAARWRRDRRPLGAPSYPSWESVGASHMA